MIAHTSLSVVLTLLVAALSFSSKIWEGGGDLFCQSVITLSAVGVVGVVGTLKP